MLAGAVGLVSCTETNEFAPTENSTVVTEKSELAAREGYEAQLLAEANDRGLSFVEPLFNQTVFEDGAVVSTVMEGNDDALTVEGLMYGVDRGLVMVSGATDDVLPDGSYTFRVQTDDRDHTIASWIDAGRQVRSTMDIADVPIIPNPPLCKYIPCSDPNFPANAAYYQQLANDLCQDIYTCQPCCMGGYPVWMAMVFKPTHWKCLTVVAHEAVADFRRSL